MKQWVWFAALWLAGVAAVGVVAFGLKTVLKALLLAS